MKYYLDAVARNAHHH